MTHDASWLAGKLDLEVESGGGRSYLAALPLVECWVTRTNIRSSETSDQVQESTSDQAGPLQTVLVRSSRVNASITTAAAALTVIAI